MVKGLSLRLADQQTIEVIQARKNKNFGVKVPRMERKTGEQ